MIKVQDWMASIPEEEKHIAYVGEGMSEQREFLLCGNGWATYGDWSFHLDMAFDPESITTRDSRQVVQTTVNSAEHKEETGVTKDEVTTKETYTVREEEVLSYDLTDVAPLDKWVEEDGIRLTWTVLRQHTLLPGKLWATIRAVSADAKRIKKSAMMVFEVEPSVSATPAAMPPVSEFEQMEAQMDALRQKTVEAAEEAAGHAEAAASAAENAEQARADAAVKAESAMRSSVTAVSAASGSAYAQQLAAESAEEAANHAKQAENHRGQAAAEANAAVEACADAKEQAQIAAEQAVAAAQTQVVVAEILTRCSEQATKAEKAAEEAAKLADAVEDVDDLTAAVFEIVESEPSANLYNPNTAVREDGFHASYPNVNSWFCEAIPCAVGDVIQVGLRGESDTLISTSNGTTTSTNAYRLVDVNGVKSKAMPNKAAIYTIPSTFDGITGDIVAVEVGVRDEVLTYNGVGVADIMVAISGTRPATFEEWRASGTDKTSRIEKNAEDIADLQEQVADLKENGGGSTIISDGQVITEGTIIGDNCAKFAKMLYGTDKAESFIFFTDPHLALPNTVNFEKKMFAHLNILKTYYDATPSSFLLCGGDWLKDISPYQTDDDACYKLGYVSSWMRANFDRYYTAIGNHEDNNPYGIDGVGGGKGSNVGLSNETIRNLMMPYEKELYYSFDGAQSKFYVMNSSDVEDVDSMNDYRWGQVAWLAQSLKDDDCDNAAIVIHAGFKRTSDTTWVLAGFSENLLKLCQAYNNGTAITLNGATYDFTDCAGCVRYVLSGHVHDSDTVENHYGIPVITTYQMTRSADSGNGNDPSFDLCLADYDTGVLRMVRVGKYGADRDVTMATRGG